MSDVGTPKQDGGDEKQGEKKAYVPMEITDLTVSLAQIQPLSRSYNTNVST